MLVEPFRLNTHPQQGLLVGNRQLGIYFLQPMKRLYGLIPLLILSAAAVEAGHIKHRSSLQNYFFRPQSNLYNFRPDLYVYGQLPYSWMAGRHYHTGGHCNLNLEQSYRTNSVSRGTYQLVIGSPAGMEIVQANTANLIFNVVPERALIFINDRLIGSARDFSTEKERYTLIEGVHDLRVEFPGYVPYSERNADHPQPHPASGFGARTSRRKVGPVRTGSIISP